MTELPQAGRLPLWCDEPCMRERAETDETACQDRRAEMAGKAAGNTGNLDGTGCCLSRPNSFPIIHACRHILISDTIGNDPLPKGVRHMSGAVITALVSDRFTGCGPGTGVYRSICSVPAVCNRGSSRGCIQSVPVGWMRLVLQCLVWRMRFQNLNSVIT